MKKLVLLGLLATATAQANVIGGVDTAQNVFGENDKIEVAYFNDEKLNNVLCYISYAKKGGIKAEIGLAEDKSDSSIHCISNGKTDKALFDSLPQKEKVWSKKSGPFFKAMQIVRLKDTKNQSVVYLTYSNGLIDGSPKNSLTVVPLTFE